MWLPIKQKTVREQLLHQYLCVPAVLVTWQPHAPRQDRQSKPHARTTC